jgi:hypothetical protein
MQAYLRMADIPYDLQPCVNASLAPSGMRATRTLSLGRLWMLCGGSWPRLCAPGPNRAEYAGRGDRVL